MNYPLKVLTNVLHELQARKSTLGTSTPELHEARIIDKRIKELRQALNVLQLAVAS